MSSRLNEIWTYGDLEQKQKLQRLVFPSGIGYDKQNNRVRTKRVNSIFSSIPLLTKDLDKIKSGEPVDFNQFSARVSPLGFEPRTASLEGRCSIQLSYGPWKPKINKNGEDFSSPSSGWQDSNLRPPRPKRGAIPGYATPRTFELDKIGFKIRFAMPFQTTGLQIRVQKYSLNRNAQDIF